MQIHKLILTAPFFLVTQAPITTPAFLTSIKPVNSLSVPALPPVAPLETAPFAYSPIGTYANAYPLGECTYGVASMKGNISWSGNANEWADKARALGITVSSVPVIGSVAQTSRGGYGHVATVVDIRPGEVLITEMNWDYNGSVRTDWQPTTDYKYIYI